MSWKLLLQIESFILLAVLRFAKACNEFAGPIFTSLHPGTAPFEEMSERWRAVGNTVSDLTGPRFEPQTFHSKDESVTQRPTARYFYYKIVVILVIKLLLQDIGNFSAKSGAYDETMFIEFTYAIAKPHLKRKLSKESNAVLIQVFYTETAVLLSLNFLYVFAVLLAINIPKAIVFSNVVLFCCFFHYRYSKQARLRLCFKLKQNSTVYWATLVEKGVL